MAEGLERWPDKVGEQFVFVAGESAAKEPFAHVVAVPREHRLPVRIAHDVDTVRFIRGTAPGASPALAVGWCALIHVVAVVWGAMTWGAMMFRRRLGHR